MSRPDVLRELDGKDVQVLRLIDNRPCPTYHEIAQAMGWSSDRSARKRVAKLAGLGLVTVRPNQPRSMFLTSRGTVAIKRAGRA